MYILQTDSPVVLARKHFSQIIYLIRQIKIQNRNPAQLTDQITHHFKAKTISYSGLQEHSTVTCVTFRENFKEKLSKIL